jgi:hypothetical protein
MLAVTRFTARGYLPQHGEPGKQHGEPGKQHSELGKQQSAPSSQHGEPGKQHSSPSRQHHFGSTLLLVCTAFLQQAAAFCPQQGMRADFVFVSRQQSEPSQQGEPGKQHSGTSCGTVVVEADTGAAAPSTDKFRANARRATAQGIRIIRIKSSPSFVQLNGYCSGNTRYSTSPTEGKPSAGWGERSFSTEPNTQTTVERRINCLADNRSGYPVQCACDSRERHPFPNKGRGQLEGNGSSRLRRHRSTTRHRLGGRTRHGTGRIVRVRIGPCRGLLHGYATTAA